MRGAVTYAQQNYDECIRKLIRARHMYGLTQEAASLEVGKSQAWVSKLEDKKIKPSLKELCEYAEIYGLGFRLEDRQCAR